MQPRSAVLAFPIDRYGFPIDLAATIAIPDRRMGQLY
jgi:hypothetical protein